jgi:chemotaxis protein CheD
VTLTRGPELDWSQAERRTHVVQGCYAVSTDAHELLTTLLGSCVAACIRDPVAGVGGMNHFLLPGEAGSADVRYGVHAMELLVNGLLQRGARRDRLTARIFGGARMVQGLSDVGALNVAFAQRFVRDEGIRLDGGSTGGVQARRVQFWPVSGRTRQMFMGGTELVEAETRAGAPPAHSGELELF